MSRKKNDKALVLGIGNLLLRDEGAGVRTVELFEAAYHFGGDVTCLDGGTSGLSLLSHIRDYSHIIIVDAVKADCPPGSVVRVSGERLAHLPGLPHASAHQLGVKDILSIAAFEGLTPKIALVGITPKKISAGMELTPEVSKALPLAAEAIREELKKFGFKASRKAH